MQRNKATAGALKAYLEIYRPGYAFLIDAPWGSGKTHFVKRETKWHENDDFHYVTLNGVDDRAAFRRALVVRLSDEKAMAAGETVLNTLGKLMKAGDVGNLLRGALEDRLIKNLPRILIFDDLERCLLDPQVLWGLLNDFVEHGGRNVVLLVHSEKAENQSSFLSRKEKVVGKTVAILADTAEALPYFVGSLPDGQGKGWINDNVAIVEKVFRESGAENLRVLKQVLQELCQLLDAIEPEILAVHNTMKRLVSTYLALAIAYGTHEVSRSDLADRGNVAILRPVPEGATPHALKAVYHRHQNDDISVAYGANVLPQSLSNQIILEGFVAPNELNASLRNTGLFVDKEDNPLWERLVRRTELEQKEYEAVVQQGFKYIFESESVDAGAYILIAIVLQDIAGFGGLDLDAASFAAAALERTKVLAQKNGFSPAVNGVHFGWGDAHQCFSYGGYSYSDEERSSDIRKIVKDAQIAAFEAGLGEEAKRLEGLLPDHIIDFANEFDFREQGTTFQNVQILHLLDATAFSEVLFQLIQNGQETLAEQLVDRLWKRHKRPLKNGTWAAESDWFDEVLKKLKASAGGHGKLLSARVEAFVKWRWQRD